LNSDKEDKDLAKENNTDENKSNNEKEIDPWGNKLIGDDDYERLCEEFGIQKIEEIDIPATIYERFRSLRRKIIFGHRDFELIIKAINYNKRWAVMSGIKPSGKFHLGSMLTAIEMINLQQLGGYVYYAIADIESYADNEMPFEVTRKYAIDNLADMLALGLDPDKAYVWLQSKEEIVNKMPYIVGTHVTNAMLKAIYGDKPFSLYLAALVQVGDILLPQLKDEIMPTVVPVGIDQDPHIRLTRDLSRFFQKNGESLFKPSSTYHKLMPGLDDITKKMNKSRPNSYFTFDEDLKVIRKKILNAFSGGRNNKDEQIKLGGVPERCMVYKMLDFLFENDDGELNERYIRCKSGQLLCGPCKKEVADKVLKFIEQHNKQKEKLLQIAEKMLK